MVEVATVTVKLYHKVHRIHEFYISPPSLAGKGVGIQPFEIDTRLSGHKGG